MGYRAHKSTLAYTVNSLLNRLPRQFNGERAVFSTTGAGKTGYPNANKVESLPFTIPTKLRMDQKSKRKS